MTNALLPLILCFLFVGCGKDEPAPAPPRFRSDLPGSEDLADLKPKFDGFQNRTYTENLDEYGQVADKRLDGTWDDQGDTTLWSWITVAHANCDDPAAKALFDKLIDAIYNNAGMIPRHDPLLEPQRPTSRDQVSGAMFGMVALWEKCQDRRDIIRNAWTVHVAYVDGVNGGNLGPDADSLMLSLRWLWGAVGQFFGAGGGGGSKQQFESGLVTTALSINAAHSPCYPIHIGTINAVTAARIGKAISPFTRGLFCDATRGTSLPLTEWYCERQRARPWLEAYVPDQHTNMNQSCLGWQGADAHQEQITPSDFFEVYGAAERGKD